MKATKPLNVAIGTTVFDRGRSDNSIDGIGTYTQRLFEGLTSNGNIQARPFCFDAAPNTLTGGAIDGGNHRRQALRSIFLRQSFSGLERALEADVVHATDHLVPKLRNTPVIASLMDVIPLAHPEWVDYPLKSLKNRLWKHSFGWADHIITISEFSKVEIVKWLGIPEEKVSSIHLGVDNSWSVPPPPEELTACLKRYGLDEGYLIAVGTLQPRKNIDRLMDAHATLPKQMQTEMPLLVVGREGWGVTELCARLRSQDSRHIKWVSRVSDEDLKSLMAGARALAFPSLYEGFGLPIIEAFAAGVPVLAANKTAIPEVAAGAALLFDPENVASIAESMIAIFESSALCEELRNAGRERAKLFYWERTTDQTIEVYRNVIS